MQVWFKAFLKKSAGYVVSTLLTAGYIALSILKFEETGKTIGGIIADAFAFYVYQIILITVFRVQGISNGQSDARYEDTIKLHGNKVESISDDMDILPLWCEEKNKQNYERQRKKILGRAALKYSDYFDKDGNAIKIYEVDTSKMRISWKNRFVRRQEKGRINAFKKAVNLKLSELDEASLTSADKTKEDKYAMPDGTKEYLSSKGLGDMLKKSLPTLIFGLYSVGDLENFSWAVFAWIVFQALIGYTSAISQMIMAKSYVVNEIRTGIVKKITWLDDFSADVKRNAWKYIKEGTNECNGEEDNNDGI